MRSTIDCPLCADTYQTETDLNVHLEVEHRKSELATYVLEHTDATSDPTVEPTRLPTEEPATPL